MLRYLPLDGALVTDEAEALFFRYWRARSLIGLGRGEEAVPLLTERSSGLAGTEEAGLDFFHVQIHQLALNYLGRYADPALALEHLDGLKPWLEDGACDSLLHPVELLRNAGELYYYQMGSTLLGAAYFNQAMDYWRTYSRDSSLLPPLLYNLGMVRNESFEYQVASDYLKAAIRLAGDYPERYDRRFLLNCMNVQGIIFSNWHRHEDAIAVWEALVSERMAHDSPFKYNHLSGEYWNLALVYALSGQYSQAEQALMQAREAAGHSRQYTDGSESIQFLNDLTDFRLLQGDPDSARALSGLAASFLAASGLPFGWVHYDWYRHRLRLLTAAGRPDRALAVLDSLLTSPQPDIDAFFRAHPPRRADMLRQGGDLARALYRQNGQSGHLARALAYYRQADSLLQEIRDASAWRPSSQYVAEHYRSVYALMLETLYEQYRKAGRQDAPAAAFDVMERNKASLLLERRQRNQYASLGQLPEDTLRLLRDLDARLAGAELDYRESPGPASRLRLDDLSAERARLVAGLEAPRERQPHRDLASWQRLCRRQARAWVSYFLADSALYALSGDGREVHFDRMPWTGGQQAALDSVIRHLRRYDDGAGYEAFTRQARRLYTWLVPEWLRNRDGVRQVVIVPDGALAFLPFEILLTQPPTAGFGNYRDLPYWVRQVSVSYAPSASLWGVLSLERDAPALSLLYAGREGGLPASQRESEALAAAWRGDWQRAADRRDFLERTGQARILHFATHAEAGLGEGAENLILLCEGEGADCRLYGYELLRHDLRGKLVLLNACETHYGRQLTGEGVYSLSRDFFMGGADAQYANLWKVEDRAAGDLLTATLGSWPGKATLSAAMTNAKRQFLEEAGPQGAHPYFWAGAVVIADSRLTGGYRNYLAVALALVLAGIMGTGWRWLNRRRVPGSLP